MRHQPSDLTPWRPGWLAAGAVGSVSVPVHHSRLKDELSVAMSRGDTATERAIEFSESAQSIADDAIQNHMTNTIK